MTDQSRTLEQLEDEDWGEPEYDSNLVQTIHKLRRKPIGEFTIEDLRVMLGQKVGMEQFIPLALDRLEADPFASGDFYPGDLLGAVMAIPREY
jgi:CDI immunity proteins